MKRSGSRILTTHVGSLVRPPEMVEILRRKDDGAPFSDGDRAILARHVAEGVRMQAECGIDIPSDGEYSKSGFAQYITDRLTGFEVRDDLHTTDAPLREIAPVILQIRAGARSLEAANPRHEHEYHIWETIKFPSGKIIIPGVIAHTTNCVEHPELVAERIMRYARLVGRENVIAGVDCGFAQGAFTARVHPTIAWAKLKALAEGAALASRELWKR